jgi:hypothetical protein
LAAAAGAPAARMSACSTSGSGGASSTRVAHVPPIPDVRARHAGKGNAANGGEDYGVDESTPYSICRPPLRHGGAQPGELGREVGRQRGARRPWRRHRGDRGGAAAAPPSSSSTRPGMPDATNASHGIVLTVAHA